MSSLLELLHPDGVAPRVRIVGNNCPGDAVSCPDAVFATLVADLVIITPDAAQAESGDWIRSAANEAAAALAPDGVLYIAAPPGARRPLIQACRAAGLYEEQAFIQHPGWPHVSLLVPLSRRAIAFAYTNIVRTQDSRRRIVLAALRLSPLLTLLRQLLPSVGVAMRRTPHRPLVNWLFSLSPADAKSGEAVISGSWRGETGPVTLAQFANGDRYPSLIAKTALGDAQPNIYPREAVNLTQIASSAERANADTPRLIAEGERGKQPVLVETMVKGKPVRHLVDNHPEKLADVITPLVGWLKNWHNQTMRWEPLSSDWVNSWWLEPAEALRTKMDLGDEYFARISDDCFSWLGKPVPVVAAHNDLTMVNVLWQEGGKPGIIDWEAAEVTYLPLTDFFYAIVDAVMDARHPGDRAAAFAACFSGDGEMRKWVAGLQGELVEGLKLPAGFVELCFQACWLRHAAEEQKMSVPGEPRPFLAILNQVAARSLA